MARHLSHGMNPQLIEPLRFCSCGTVLLRVAPTAQIWCALQGATRFDRQSQSSEGHALDIVGKASSETHLAPLANTQRPLLALLLATPAFFCAPLLLCLSLENYHASCRPLQRAKTTHYIPLSRCAESYESRALHADLFLFQSSSLKSSQVNGCAVKCCSESNLNSACAALNSKSCFSFLALLVCSIFSAMASDIGFGGSLRSTSSTLMGLLGA